MKRSMIWLLIIALAFSGCAAAQDDPFRVDTVVQIPVDPTDTPTEEPSEAPTEESTEAPTEAPTEPQETTAPKSYSSNQGGSSGKGSSSGNNQSSKNQKPKETDPPETITPTEAPPAPPYDPSSYSVGNLEYAILDELNAYRGEKDVAELSLSGRLSGIAYLRAKEAIGAWGHTRPDGRDYTSALSDYGYGYSSSAELMVYTAGSGDAAQMVAKWMNAKSHSKKVLSDSFSTAGIGVYRKGGTTYVVCLLVG